MNGHQFEIEFNLKRLFNRYVSRLVKGSSRLN